MNFISIFLIKKSHLYPKDKAEGTTVGILSLRTGERFWGLFLSKLTGQKCWQFTQSQQVSLFWFSWFFNWNARDSALQAHSLAGSGGLTALSEIIQHFWIYPTWHLLQVLFWAMEMKSLHDACPQSPESWSEWNPSHSSKRCSIPNYAHLAKRGLFSLMWEVISFYQCKYNW